MKLLGNKYINQLLRDLLKIGGVYVSAQYAGLPQVVGVAGATIGTLLGYLDKYNNQAPVPKA